MDEQEKMATAQVAEVQGVPVLRVSGEIDNSSVGLVHQETMIWLDTTTSTSVIDLSGVTFLASAGLALLVEAAHHAERCGTSFVIVAGHRAVMRAIQLTGLGEAFTIYPDLDQAVSALREAAAATTSPGSTVPSQAVIVTPE